MENRTSELSQGMGSISRRHIVATCVALAALAVVAVSPQLLGGRVLAGFRGLDAARPGLLWLAGLSFAASLAAAGLAWRVGLRTCGSGLDRGDAVSRYCVGSALNALTPARLGGAVRIGLYARTLDREGAIWTSSGLAAAIGAARAVCLLGLLVVAIVSGVLALWIVGAVLGAIAVAGGLVVASQRLRSGRRVAHALDAFRELGRSPRALLSVIGWMGVATAARVGSATFAAASLGIHHPLTGALLVVPVVDFAATLPLTPGNAGVSSAAVAFALKAHGAASSVALSAGIALAGVETLAALIAGCASALVLFAPAGVPQRRLAMAGAGIALLALGGAFGATVLLPAV
jgi:uncharacterized membrane protein YbhN (UPF0104 family)